MIELLGGDDYTLDMLCEMYDKDGYTFVLSAGKLIGMYEPGGEDGRR